jgi:hypothetical protein
MQSTVDRLLNPLKSLNRLQPACRTRGRKILAGKFGCGKIEPLLKAGVGSGLKLPEG